MSALVAGLACYGVMLGFAAARPQATPNSASVSAWLTRHQLRNGVGGYWQASSVMLDTHGAISIGLVPPDAGGLASWHWEANTRLVNSALSSANFLITMSGESVTPARAELAFGRPARVYRYQDYTIMVWHKNILRALGHPTP